MRDLRWWANKRKIAFKNISGEVCPAFTPVVFSWDNQAGVPSPWQAGDDGDTSGTIRHNQLVFPIAFGCMAETGYVDCFYAINGPFDVQPGGYGECSMDYPLPLLFDAESFPIPDEADPNGPPIPTDWEGYLEQYPGDIEGPPPCGFNSAEGVDGGWQPATFMADFLLWQVLYWDVEADGTPAADRAIVVPFDARGGDIPVVGNNGVFFEEDCEEDVEYPVIGLGWPLAIEKRGLYSLSFFGTLGIDATGVGAKLTLQVTFGELWDEFDISNTPMAANYDGAPPASGETKQFASVGRKLTRIKITVDTEVSVTDPYDPSEEDEAKATNTVTIDYEDYGYETLWFIESLYLLPGDEIELIVTTDSNDLDTGDPVPVNIQGTFNFQKISGNPPGTFGIYY